MNTILSVQPLVLAHNNEVVCIERNEELVERKFSSFKIFKLKGPIDTDYLLNVIFPPSERNYYDLEVSEYNGQSAKVKFLFTDRTHLDLITYLKDAAANFLNVSENGLLDWLASDTITFKTIYQNTDMAAINQIRSTLEDTSSSSSSSSSLSSMSTTDLQLYPIVDEEAIEKELEGLSKQISSQTFLTNYDLEKLFHKTFARKDMTVTINDIFNEYFSQIDGVVGFVFGPHDKKLIEDGEALNPSTIIRTFADYLFRHSEHYINPGVIGGFVKDYKFGVIVTLWNIINACHSIQLSYKMLLESEEGIKEILLSKKSEFEDCLSNIDQILMDILIIISDELDREKYKRLQRRFGNFIKSIETLMKLVMIINKEFSEQLEKLEKQGKDLSTKLWSVAVSIGFSALVIGGSLYFKSTSLKRYEKWAIGAITGTAAITAGAGYSTISKIQNSIEQQTNILIQLKLTYSKLEEWKTLSYEYVDYDLNDMNNHKRILIEEFVRVRLQCKSLSEIFDDYR